MRTRYNWSNRTAARFRTIQEQVEYVPGAAELLPSRRHPSLDGSASAWLIPAMSSSPVAQTHSWSSPNWSRSPSSSMSQKTDLAQVRDQILHRTVRSRPMPSIDQQQTKIATGKLLTLPTTRSIPLPAQSAFSGQFENADLKLYPNQFVNARLLVKTSDWDGAVLFRRPPYSATEPRLSSMWFLGTIVSKIRNINELTTRKRHGCRDRPQRRRNRPYYRLRQVAGWLHSSRSRAQLHRRQAASPDSRQGGQAGSVASEPFADVHPAADRHHPDDGCDPCARPGRLYDAAHLRAPRG